ncbi:MAG: hypothetical protein ABWX96_15710 [Propionibacteriaceae bacterium]
MGHLQDFSFTTTGDDSVVITHGGRVAARLHGTVAQRFLVDVEQQDPQLLMAKLTGNYKHGNERTARNHPRNRRG